TRQCYPEPRDLRSFPTRRSSDLKLNVVDGSAFEDIKLKVVGGEARVTTDVLFQLSICEMADSMTQSPIIMENGCCSILGRNSPGGTKPRMGSCQRSKASNPSTSPVTMLTLGW